MATAFDQLSATTRAAMQQDVVQDNLFIEGGLQRVVRFYANEDPFGGGLFMQEPYLYDRPTGGASVPGATREVVDKQLLAAMAFAPREYIEEIPLNEWQLEVINRGPNAAVSIYDVKMEAAVRAFNTDWNFDAYRHGQASSGTNVNQDRSIFVNGLDEVCNDGISKGWMGNIYTTYGGETRNSTEGNVLNGIILWAGDQAGALGQVSYLALLRGYLYCTQAPDTGLCNKELFALIAAREEPKQRFTQEADVRIGLTGFKVMDAYIHVDKLCPSTKYGAIVPSNLSQTSTLSPSTFTSPAYSSGGNTVSGFPASKTIYVGEPFWWARLKDFKFRPSDSPMFRHYFKGPIDSQEAPDLQVMFYREALNWYTPSPRDNCEIIGFGY